MMATIRWRWKCCGKEEWRIKRSSHEQVGKVDKLHNGPSAFLRCTKRRVSEPTRGTLERDVRYASTHYKIGIFERELRVERRGKVRMGIWGGSGGESFYRPR